MAGGPELDLMLFKAGRRYGIEVKRSDAPRRTTSMASALDDFGLEQLAVIYPGDRRFEIDRRIVAVPATDVAKASWRTFF